MRILPQEDGLRLDAALLRLLPDLGLRARRRICGNGLALVNGRPQKAAYKVRTDDDIEVSPLAADPAPTGGGNTGAHVLCRNGHLAFLYKPSGMHCASLAGNTGITLESLLPDLLPGSPSLMNRLDLPTSGIVIAALDAQGKEFCRKVQLAGQAEKRYLAVLEGNLTQRLETQRAITQDSRRRVRVLHGDDPDPLRRTVLVPLASLDSAHFAPNREPSPLTLAGCMIYRGARHQIRAHAAALGFPLFGDVLYGGTPAEGEPPFYLHHGAAILPGFRTAVPPPFPLPQDMLRIAMQWLEAR